MLVNRIPKHQKKSLGYKIIYRALKKIQQKKETNPLSILRHAMHRVAPNILLKKENFILDSTRISMKPFHLLLFDGSFIFPECILIFGLIHLLMIYSTSDQKDMPWLYSITSISLEISITAMLFNWRKEPMKFLNEQFQRNHYIECTEIALTKFLLFTLTATLGGMFLCGANNLITIFVAPECFILWSYLLSRYAKKDVQFNKATMKYLLVGGASSSVLVHTFSWLYS
ncbi:hypothetical protein Cgig2_034059 [Carnegiea gigantea]|uniref:NADH dehydrogenase subunit 2 n=1 Tax=Carnegiea gigantea TaxID=171969 RepID=A0A9Q1QK85_9CARY|nr:hypothetical protein Cgig2_034059 [Carnegiea gigantea]